MERYGVPVPRIVPGAHRAGEPQLLYVSCWEQTVSTLPRSLHRHSDFAELTFILAGRSICELDGIFYPIAKGDLIVCNCGALHDEYVEPQAISLVSFAAGGIQLPGLAPNCIVQPNASPVFHLQDHFPEFQDLISLLIDTVRGTQARRSLICQALFQALFYLALDVIDRQLSGPPAASGSADLGHRIRAYVDAHVTEDISVHAIAAHFQISPSYLARVFKRSIGYSLSKYIIRRRLGEAQSLLLNSRVPISEVALRVGYTNQSYFTKLFTQSFRVSPLQYRKIASERLINLPPEQTHPPK